MKFFRKSLSVFLIVALVLSSTFFSCFFVSSATVTTAYIEGDNVNVRTGPATTFPVIEKLSHTSVTVVSSVQTGDNIWYQVTYKNEIEEVSGYIPKYYVACVDEEFLIWQENYVRSISIWNLRSNNVSYADIETKSGGAHFRGDRLSLCPRYA